jgi:cellulose synthase operon protein C
MDPRQQEALVRRLVQNPQDQAAIAEAHAAGQSDPGGYASLLEKVGHASREPALAAHWLNEAANVWLATFNDLHRGATTLMAAVEKDPTAEAPAARLADLYRQGRDYRALVALYERRALTVASRPDAFPGGVHTAAALLEELGRLCAEPPVSDIEKARDSFTRALELNPESHFSIYSVREIHKQREEWLRALPYFAMEQSIVHDPSRKLALYLDESEVAKRAARPDIAIRALRSARQLDPADPALRQQLATITLERVRAGQGASPDDRAEAADLFVQLAEQYSGEHGFLYALCGLELDPTSERGCQLVMHYGDALGRTAEAAPQLAAFVTANPGSSLAPQAHRVASGGSSVGRSPLAGALSPGVSLGASGSRTSPLGRPAQVETSRPDVGEDLDTLLDAAAQFAKKSRKTEAITAYQKVLHLDPGNEEAVAYLQQQLPPKRKYAELRDVLWTAGEVVDADVDKRVAWLTEAATLCERQLKDFDGAAAAWRMVLEIDGENDGAREQYKRLLERARRWDDLAELLRQEADATEDLEVRIAIEKNLAKLHNDKRKDPASAGQAWARIAALTPGDEIPLLEAVKHLERAERFDLAADVIAEHVASIDDEQAQHELYGKLGRLRAEGNDLLGAAEAMSDGAMKLKDAGMWAAAEGYYRDAESWQQAAGAAIERIAYAKKDPDRAELNAAAARYLLQAGEVDEAITRLEQAVELAPDRVEYADELEQRLTAADRVEDVARIFLRRADKLEDKRLRVELRRRAAILQRDRLNDIDAARAGFVLVLRDEEDPETLTWLADDAEERSDFDNAVRYLWRLGAAVDEPQQKTDVLLREGALHSGELGKPDIAIERYEKILAEVDPKCEAALERIADIEIGRDRKKEGAEALERLLAIAESREKRLEVARQLGDLYEHSLKRIDDAMRVLQIVHAADPDDFDATERLCLLAEAGQRWPLFAELMVELISVEGDETQVSAMTRRLAQILHEQLDDGDEALNVLGSVADAGDTACRNEFVSLGDRLGKKDLVARRMVSWCKDEGPSEAREETLHGAFERFLEVGQKRDAVEVAKLLAASRQLRAEKADVLESLGVELKDLDAIAAAHALKATSLSDSALAVERVRQAEVLAEVGVEADAAVTHGEQALASAAQSDLEGLLARLAALLAEPAQKIDVYERQVTRSADAEARLGALCRAAEVAAEYGDTDRAHGFFDLVLGGGIEENVVSRLVAVARMSDERQGGKGLRTILAESLASSGQTIRDGGKTRALCLRRAAVLAFEELKDSKRSLGWLSDAIVTYVDDDALDTLEELAENLGDFKKAESVITRALEEVFDGPMVRKLLARRAALREERLDDPRGAAEDLKKLLDLSPTQTEIAEQLADLYTRLRDFRGLVQLHEDQILRGRDKDKRAQLARLVARLWQEQLRDPREAADAWRRVLRMASGDEEAKEGLARAKELMLAARNDAPDSNALSGQNSSPSGAAAGSSPVAASQVAPGAHSSVAASPKPGSSPSASAALRSAPAQGSAPLASAPAASSPATGSAPHASAPHAAPPSAPDSSPRGSSPGDGSVPGATAAGGSAAASAPAASAPAASAPAASSSAASSPAASAPAASAPAASAPAASAPAASAPEQGSGPAYPAPAQGSAWRASELDSRPGSAPFAARPNAADASPLPGDALPPASTRDDDDVGDGYDSGMIAAAALALGSDRPRAEQNWESDEELTVRGSSDLDSQAELMTPPPSPMPSSPTPPPPPGLAPPLPLSPPPPTSTARTGAADGSGVLAPQDSAGLEGTPPGVDDSPSPNDDVDEEVPVDIASSQAHAAPEPPAAPHGAAPPRPMGGAPPPRPPRRSAPPPPPPPRASRLPPPGGGAAAGVAPPLGAPPPPPPGRQPSVGAPPPPPKPGQRVSAPGAPPPRGSRPPPPPRNVPKGN